MCGSAREYRGRSFPSLQSLAREVGLNPGTIWERLSRGWSVERAVNPPPSPRPTVYRRDGREFPTIAALSVYFGIPPTTLGPRLRAVGYDAERLELGPKPRTVAQRAAEMGVATATLYRRLYRHGSVDPWGGSKDLRTDGPKCRAVVIDGVRYGSIRGAARALGVPYATLHHRLKAKPTSSTRPT